MSEQISTARSLLRMRQPKLLRGGNARPKANPFTFYEFFAGGGMVRAGLGAKWSCLFANDFNHKKCATYQENWGGTELVCGDVAKIETGRISSRASLVWASFPCQDLSLAGMGAGLKGDRSGTFWPFWKLIKSLKAERRGPKVIVLENVVGTLTSHGGRDFSAIVEALQSEGFRCGALVIDAAAFVPQSRPRLFVIAASADTELPEEATDIGKSDIWKTNALRIAHDQLSKRAKENWVWWKLPPPPPMKVSFGELIEDHPESTKWHSEQETRKLLAMMSERNLAKVISAQRSGKKLVGTVYKRTRFDEDEKVQRAEVRFDGIAGCLRTAAGGSSRQLIIVVKGASIRSRLISTREAARLMGLPDNYKLPTAYNEAYHLLGDGVAVPVVRYIAENLLEPLIGKINAEERYVGNYSVRQKFGA